MRGFAMLLVACLLLSGCSGKDPATDDVPDGSDADASQTSSGGTPDVTDGGPAAAPDPPADVVFTGSMVWVSNALPAPVGPPDCLVPDQQCVEHVVAVPAGDWKVTFTLVSEDGTVTGQGFPDGTDYDLSVAGVGDSANGSGEEDVVEDDLAPGDYTAQVLAWHDIDGSYTLTVSFAAA